MMKYKQLLLSMLMQLKTDAKRTIDNSETEKQMQINFKQFGFSFQKKVTP